MNRPLCTINHGKARRHACPAKAAPPSEHTGPRVASGFSMTELLVVIAIIVVLAGLLLMAMGTVRATAMRSSTTSTMKGFADSADAFHTEHGRYPGAIPDHVLAKTPHISSTENALIELMGGFRALQPGSTKAAQDDFNQFRNASPNPIEYTFPSEAGNWMLVVDVQRLGEGPVLNRKAYAPYFTPGPREVQIAEGQMTLDGGWTPQAGNELPDLMDGWGQPIVYLRQVRTRGPLVGPFNASEPELRPQFVLGTGQSILAGMAPYLYSTGLGALGRNQSFDPGTNARGSILTQGSPQDIHTILAQVLRNPSFGDPQDPLGLVNPNQRERVRPRGAYALFSAGKDGIFFSAEDGPGTPGSPVTQIDDPNLVKDYDDVIFFGGG
jgi:prepilin-type N-terminal cleavage/methylation domain-containing protein